MSTVGIDIGGANLKFASSRGDAVSVKFPMWKHPDQLTDALVANLKELRPFERVAVTMTGELADCFYDREHGVRHIVRQTEEAVDALQIQESQYYAVDGNFHSAESTMADPDLFAAANWHALATYVGREFCPDGLLVDIGSTTTDVILISNGQVATSAKTDFDRLAEGSLVYVGCRRTPLCALASTVCFRGQRVSVMNELFATIDDALLVVGSTLPNEQCDTADGRTRSVKNAINRIGRMVGLDHRQISNAEAVDLAQQFVTRTSELICDAVARNNPVRIVCSGHGRSLFQPPSDCEMIELSSCIGEDASRCAPAFALAQLRESTSYN